MGERQLGLIDTQDQTGGVTYVQESSRIAIRYDGYRENAAATQAPAAS